MCRNAPFCVYTLRFAPGSAEEGPNYVGILLLFLCRAPVISVSLCLLCPFRCPFFLSVSRFLGFSVSLSCCVFIGCLPGLGPESLVEKRLQTCPWRQKAKKKKRDKRRDKAPADWLLGRARLCLSAKRWNKGRQYRQASASGPSLKLIKSTLLQRRSCQLGRRERGRRSRLTRPFKQVYVHSMSYVVCRMS